MYTVLTGRENCLPRHPVYFKKTSAAPLGNRSPQLRGAWVCTWADLQNLQGGAAPPHQTETRWTEKEILLCLSAPLVKTPHFGRLLCWMGLARCSLNYSGWRLKVVEAHFIRLATVCTDIGTVIKVVECMCHMILERFWIGEDIIADVTCVCCVSLCTKVRWASRANEWVPWKLQRWHLNVEMGWICSVALEEESLLVSFSLSCTGSSSWSELSSAKLLSFSRAVMTDLCLDVTWLFITEFLLAL